MKKHLCLSDNMNEAVCEVKIDSENVIANGYDDCDCSECLKRWDEFCEWIRNKNPK